MRLQLISDDIHFYRGINVFYFQEGNMKKNRALAYILSSVLAASTLAGCGFSGASTQATSDSGDSVTTEAAEAITSEESSAASSTSTADNGETVTIKMTYLTSGTAPEGLERIQDALSEITREKINCNVELVPVSFSDQATKYNMWFANGDNTDIIITVFLDYLSMINSGAIQPLDDLVAEYGKDLLAKDKDKQFLGAGEYQGKLYGIPTIPDAPGNGGAMYMRKDIYDTLDTSGLDADGDGYYDYEDMDNMFQQIYEKFPDYTTLGVAGNRTKSLYFYVRNYDNLGVSGESSGVLVDPLNSTKVENLYATDQYKEYLEWMRKWYQAGYISKDAPVSEESGEDLFEAGKTATYIGMSTPGTREGAEVGLGSEVVELDLVPTYMTTNVYTGVLFFVPKNAQYPEKAVEFLNLLFNDAEVNNLLAEGQEGVDYDFSDKENGIIKFRDDRTYVNTYGVWGDKSQKYLEYPQTADMRQKQADYLQESLDHTSLANGYKFDASSVATEQSTVKSVISKYLTQLEYGTVDLDTVYPEFLDELDKAGINTIIEENQKQLDAWLADQSK